MCPNTAVQVADTLFGTNRSAKVASRVCVTGHRDSPVATHIIFESSLDGDFVEGTDGGRVPMSTSAAGKDQKTGRAVMKNTHKYITGREAWPLLQTGHAKFNTDVTIKAWILRPSYCNAALRNMTSEASE